MDLSERIRSIDNRLYKLETVSRLRAAAISEGVTEFVEEGQLVIEDGGSFIINDGGAIGGASWELGVNPDGTTYANVGDVLLRTQTSPPVTEYIDLESVPTVLDSPITIVNQDIPPGVSYAVVIGTLNVMADEDLRAIIRVRSSDVDISTVVLEGQTLSIPLIMKFSDKIRFEIHATDTYELDSSFEAIYQREVEDV